MARRLTAVLVLITLGIGGCGKCRTPRSETIWSGPPTTVRPIASPPPNAQQETEVRLALEYLVSQRASRSRPRGVPPPGRRPPRSGPHRGYASWWECSAAVENGGSYDRSSNPTHFGRYQFSRSAWAGFGGDPAKWGTASPAEQDRVWENARNTPGAERQWTPYNGCG